MASKIPLKFIAKRKKMSNLKNLSIGMSDSGPNGPWVPAVSVPENISRFLELEKEISEREQFLNEMTSIGQGQKYNAIIKGSISKR